MQVHMITLLTLLLHAAHTKIRMHTCSIYHHVHACRRACAFTRRKHALHTLQARASGPSACTRTCTCIYIPRTCCTHGSYRCHFPRQNTQCLDRGEAAPLPAPGCQRSHDPLVLRTLPLAQFRRHDCCDYHPGHHCDQRAPARLLNQQQLLTLAEDRCRVWEGPVPLSFCGCCELIIPQMFP